MKPTCSVTFLAVLLASLSALQAAESQTPAANLERMPAFSWDTVPLYVHIRKDSYFDLKDGYDAKTSKIWMTHRADYDRLLGAPKGPAVRDGYTYTWEFAHASVRLDIENQTGEVVGH
jgi:hypothetical protein